MAGRTKRNDVDVVLFDGPGEPSLSEAIPPGTFILNERTGVLSIRRQDMSLLSLSAAQGYGGLLIHEASAGQVFATGDAQKMTVWESALPESGGVDGQLANNRIVIGMAGVYLLAWHLSFITSGPADWVGHIYLDGVSSGVDWDRNVSGAGGPGSVSCAAPVTVPAGAVVEAYISHDQGGDRTLTPANSQLYAVRVG